MDMDADLVREWITAARNLQASIDRFPPRVADTRPTSGAQAGSISVQLDTGKSPWLMQTAVTAAILCAVLSTITLIGGGMLYLNMKDHLDAIYMMAPQLQPPEATPYEHHHSDPQAEAPINVRRVPGLGVPAPGGS